MLGDEALHQQAEVTRWQVQDVTDMHDNQQQGVSPVEGLSQGRLCCVPFLGATSRTFSMSAKDTSATASQLVSTLKLSCRIPLRCPGTALINWPCTMHHMCEAGDKTV